MTIFLLLNTATFFLLLIPTDGFKTASVPETARNWWTGSHIECTPEYGVENISQPFLFWDFLRIISELASARPVEVATAPDYYGPEQT